MTILVTGAAGFIGFHVAQELLRQGEKVIGLDNLNDYYEVELKNARLAQLGPFPNFTFVKLDIADRQAIDDLFKQYTDELTHIVHLAAQAGVRYSLKNPAAYIQSNVMGHLNILEAARHLGRLEHLVYASSSSVYGLDKDYPFAVETSPADNPASIYAATKRCDELMSYSYAHLYKLPQTGLRFFTVYGPWGRPDMAAFLFCNAIRDGRPIEIFNHGNMRRDFTYIDDIVAGVIAAMKKIPTADSNGVQHRLYNLGNHRPENLADFIAVIETEFGRSALKIEKPLQPGDIPETYADIASSQADLGFEPRTNIQDGLKKFVAWYKSYYQL